jgi:hypothetical protein
VASSAIYESRTDLFDPDVDPPDAHADDNDAPDQAAQAHRHPAPEFDPSSSDEDEEDDEENPAEGHIPDAEHADDPIMPGAIPDLAHLNAALVSLRGLCFLSAPLSLLTITFFVILVCVSPSLALVR